jgi:uncharacterized protein (TIGR02231 family)
MDTWTLNSIYNINDEGNDVISNKTVINEPTQEGEVIFKEISVNELNSEFRIPLPYTILSDSKPYIVEVASYNLNAAFDHFCVPKIESEAFLVAKVTGWNDLNLVSGDASVYFNGSYIGQSLINTSSVNDTLVLSLGRDKKITVKRTLRADESRKQVIGKDEKETSLYEIVIRNNRDVSIYIEVQDQVPVSTESDIDVTVNEISNAEYDKLNGKLTWKLKINPGETKQMAFSYTIKYPKGAEVSKKKFRSISCPSF